MDLHINYESVEPYSLKVQHEGHNQVRAIHESPRRDKPHRDNPKAKLRAIPEDGHIILDDNTQITGIPDLAWQYKLGNRSALHWILDQYKEKKPKDPTIAEKFNTYKLADYKVQVIDLIKRVCTVSVKTVEIVQQMEIEEPHN